MAQPLPKPPTSPKTPLDSLQAMLNGILIETGRALKASHKDGRRTQAHNIDRPQVTIPKALETFHGVLDDIEMDIVRSKAILLRDLEVLRAKRIAKETPAPAPAPVVQKLPETIIPPKSAEPQLPMAPVVDMVKKIPQPGKSPVAKQEVIPKPPEKSAAGIKPPQAKAEPPTKETTKSPEQIPKKLQALSPPPSSNENTQNSKPVGLGINTDAKPAPDEPRTSEPQNSGVDSLFDDIPEAGNGNVDLNFDDMDFSYGANTQTTDQPQTQNSEFDLSTFGNTSQNLSTNNSNSATAGQSGNNNANSGENKQSDEILAIGDLGDLGDIGGGDSMDLDLNLDMFGAEDSVFDDMFVDGVGLSGGGAGAGENTYDDAFFGLND
ncbi:hypothetical protein HYALB_00001821 [Hymenoscyphus albidus]|uniref:Uncharacterized protein n=1 Tax=Hymenoscyphus albidus TaxID=595503 RepID=A0A9N9Q8K3_9HELO|nr:hypothetical protein HYALB_00001821 [Hymenoscyphus albidus]